MKLNRFSAVITALVIGIVLTGCGGGSSGSGGSSPVSVNQKTVTISAGQSLQTTIGQATISSGVFANQTEVKLTETSAVPPVPQPTFAANKTALTIEIKSGGAWPIGGLKASYPDTSNGQPATSAVYNGSDLVDSPPVTKQPDGQLTITIDPTNLPTNANRSRSASLGVTLLLGYLTKYHPPDPTVTLIPVGPIQNNGRIAILVHGLMQTAADEMPTALALKDTGYYGAIYLLGYDWRSPIDAVATKFATFLATFPDKSVDLYSYSKGGLISRWTTKELGATKAVRQTIYLGTPNLGCGPDLMNLYRLLSVRFLLHSSELPAVYDPNDSCLAELLPSSNRLATLNAPSHRQNGNVDYLFVAGNYLLSNNDLIVTVDSALMNNNDAIANETNGRLDRLTLKGQTHFTIDDPQTVLGIFAQLAKLKSGIEITFDNNPNEASTFYGSWRTIVTITNQTNQMVTTNSLLYERYDRSGKWNSNFWHDPFSVPGEFFPQERTPWNQAIDPGQSIQLYVETWPDTAKTPVWDAIDSRQANTVSCTLLATGANGDRYEANAKLTLTYNGITPTAAETRAAHGPTSQNPAGIGPARH